MATSGTICSGLSVGSSPALTYTVSYTYASSTSSTITYNLSIVMTGKKDASSGEIQYYVGEQYAWGIKITINGSSTTIICKNPPTGWGNNHYNYANVDGGAEDGLQSHTVTGSVTCNKTATGSLSTSITYTSNGGNMGIPNAGKISVPTGSVIASGYPSTPGLPINLSNPDEVGTVKTFIDQSNYTISWEHPTDGGPVTGYEIIRSLNGVWEYSTNTYPTNGRTPRTTAGGSYTWTNAVVNYGDTVRFAVRAYNGSIYGDWVHTVTFYKYKALTAPVISNPAAGSSIAGTITFAWNSITGTNLTNMGAVKYKLTIKNKLTGLSYIYTDLTTTSLSLNITNSCAASATGYDVTIAVKEVNAPVGYWSGNTVTFAQATATSTIQDFQPITGFIKPQNILSLSWIDPNSPINGIDNKYKLVYKINSIYYTVYPTKNLINGRICYDINIAGVTRGSIITITELSIKDGAATDYKQNLINFVYTIAYNPASPILSNPGATVYKKRPEILLKINKDTNSYGSSVTITCAGEIHNTNDIDFETYFNVTRKGYYAAGQDEFIVLKPKYDFVVNNNQISFSVASANMLGEITESNPCYFNYASTNINTDLFLIDNVITATLMEQIRTCINNYRASYKKSLYTFIPIIPKQTTITDTIFIDMCNALNELQDFVFNTWDTASMSNTIIDFNLNKIDDTSIDQTIVYGNVLMQLYNSITQ